MFQIIQHFRTGWNDQLPVQQICCLNVSFLGKRIIRFHQYPALLRAFQLDIGIFCQINRFQQNCHVKQAALQTLTDIIRTSCKHVKFHTGMCLLEVLHHPRHFLHGLELTTADPNRTLQLTFTVLQLLLRLIHKIQDLPCPSFQQNALFTQTDAMTAAHKQRYAKFLLQLGYLPAQRRLRDMNDLRSPVHALLAGSNQEILQQSQFHFSTSSFSYCITVIVFHLPCL